MNLRHFHDRDGILQSCTMLSQEQKAIVLKFFSQEIEFDVGKIIDYLHSHLKEFDIEVLTVILKTLSESMKFTKNILISEKFKEVL